MRSGPESTRTFERWSGSRSERMAYFQKRESRASEVLPDATHVASADPSTPTRVRWAGWIVNIGTRLPGRPVYKRMQLVSSPASTRQNPRRSGRQPQGRSPRVTVRGIALSFTRLSDCDVCSRFFTYSSKGRYRRCHGTSPVHWGGEQCAGGATPDELSPTREKLRSLTIKFSLRDWSVGPVGLAGQTAPVRTAACTRFRQS